MKAASVGNKYMVRTLIEHGVDPRHTDPYGNTALDKAKLYNHTEVIKYLTDVLANLDESKIVDWKDPSLTDMSGKLRSFMHY